MRRTYEDMPALKYKVELNESERTHLKEIASRGETSARKVKRALVLLKADEGLIDRDIASGLIDKRIHGGTCAHAVCEGGTRQRAQ